MLRAFREYCARDTELPLMLMEKLNAFGNLLEFANAVRLPVKDVLDRGQQIRAFSLISKMARDKRFLIPDDKEYVFDEKYEGATVLEAQVGFHDDIVVALDFMSLYPSIIRAHKLSFDTLVLDPVYANVPGIEYHDIETDQGTFRFAQTPAVIPDLLEDLARFRTQAKKEMHEATKRGDAWAASLADSKQKAFKVVANSVYGYLGATKGFQPCNPIAASTTATGRRMIRETQERVLRLYPGSRVVYGDTDSVMVVLNLDEVRVSLDVLEHDVVRLELLVIDNRHDLQKHFEEAQKLADAITETFAKPNVLEFEKAYWPFALYSKKRYAGAMYTTPHRMDKVDVKGLVTVRRDNAPIVRDVCHDMLDAIILRKDPHEALEIARRCLARVLDNDIPFDKFKVSKALRSGYKNKAQPHVSVAEKILQRTKTPVPSGTRVSYVFPKGDPGLSLSDRAEDPEYAQENGMQIDALFYIEHQLTNPLVSLLEIVCADPAKALFREEPVKTLYERAIAQRNAETAVLKRRVAQERRDTKRIKLNSENKQHEITHFFKKSV